jgi:hypothetical protein
VDRFAVHSGGVTSTGSVYAVTGAIGQSDAGSMSGGNSTLAGGFWSVIAAIQTPGAPYLTVTHGNQAVIVSWPLPADGWVLETASALPHFDVPWTQIPPPYKTSGANLQFIESLPGGHKFFRLRKP